MYKDKQEEEQYLNVMHQNTENSYQNVINYVKHLRPLSLHRKVKISQEGNFVGHMF